MNTTDKSLCHIMGYEIQILILYSMAIKLKNKNSESDSSNGVLETVIDFRGYKIWDSCTQLNRYMGQ